MWKFNGKDQHFNIQPNGCEYYEQPLFPHIAIPNSLNKRQFFEA